MSKLALLGAGPSGSGDPYAAYLVYDSFTDDDDVAIASHTPEADTVGGGYSVVNGTAANYKIASNKLLIDEANGDWGFAKIDAGNADVVIAATLTLAGNNPGVYVRITDEDNCWFCNTSVSGNVLRIQKRDGGSVTTEATTGQTYTASDVIAVTITLSGNSLSVEDTTNTKTATVASDSFNNDKTEYGMGGNNCSGALFDDLTIVAN